MGRRQKPHPGAAKALKALNWTGLRVERIVTHVADGMAASVWLERATREVGEPRSRTLRVTHVYRREQGQWRLLLRHANPVSPEDEATEQSLLST
jgi:hypothetical protein